MDNVIKFPKPNVREPVVVPTVEDINETVKTINHYHIQEAIQTMAPHIFGQLEMGGFPLSEQENPNMKYGALVIEALRAIMCDYYGIYHPLQDVANNIFEVDPDYPPDSNAFLLAKSINVTFKDTEEKNMEKGAE